MAEKKRLIRGVTVVVFVLMVWVLYISSKHLERNQRIQEEVTTLQTEADKIRRENETLAEKITYFSTANFQELEAKEKLGMKKNDESVVVLKQERATGTSVDEESGAIQTIGGTEATVQPPAEEGALPNYRKWWQLFF